MSARPLDITVSIGMSHHALKQLVHDLAHFEQLSVQERCESLRRTRLLPITTPDDVAALFDALLANSRPADAAIPGLSVSRSAPLLSDVLARVWRCQEGDHDWPPPDDGLLSAACELYTRLGPDCRSRYHLLRLLSGARSRGAFERFSRLLAADPPSEAHAAALALAPLFRPDSRLASWLFPSLWDALAHPSTAAGVLDLANHLWRKGAVAPHPASDRAAQLTELLGSIVGRLSQLESASGPTAATPEETPRLVAESVALVIGLCDALGAIGDPIAVGKLHQALELAHRRVRTEAGAALARLGDEAGVAALVEMAGEMAVRLRAIAYLDELGLGNKVPEAYRAPDCTAQAELCAWLAERHGISPNFVELIDARRQFWPGFNDPRDCFLVRYEYRLREQRLAGIGIVGPVTFAVPADLSDLPPADIYAVYAGWHAEHDEIAETSFDGLSDEARGRWSSIAGDLEAAGYTDVQLVKMGDFFGERHMVATARRGAQPGTLICDGRHAEWHPQRGGSRSPGPAVVYYLYKGRKLLRAFNR